MKTAISVPDDIYRRADQVAAAHGLNRSQFYSAAAQHYAAALEGEERTAAIDAALAGAQDPSAGFAVEAGRRILDAAEW